MAAAATPRSSHGGRGLFLLPTDAVGRSRRPEVVVEAAIQKPTPPEELTYPGQQLGLPPPYYYYYSPALYNYYNNYPAPVHRRAISPSTQYPAPPSSAADPSSVPDHIPPPQNIADIRRAGRMDPQELDIYQRIASLDLERPAAAAADSSISVRPLATSSPPGKRRKQEEDEEEEEARVVVRGAAVLRFQEPPPEALPQAGGRSKPRLATPPVAEGRAGQSTTSFVGGGVVKRRGVGSRLRESHLQTLRELSEGETATSSSNAGGELEPGEDGRRSRLLQRDSDLVSVVSEGLDAEVTAITSSSSSPSSPEGSGATNTLQHHTRGGGGGSTNNNTTSSSGFATRSSQNTTASSFSSSSGQQNQSLLSSSSGSFHQQRHPYLSPASPTLTTSKALRRLEEEADYEAGVMPTYENWPPRPYIQAYSGLGTSPPFQDLSSKLADMSPEGGAVVTPGDQFVGYYHQELPPGLTAGVPPLTPHHYQTPPPMAGRYHARLVRAGSAEAAGSPANSSLETPSPTSASGGRPHSSQSAPLDRSVDRHYEWDTATPPAGSGQQHLVDLPPEWAAVMERRRRSPAYNPRRDRDIGPMVQMANRDRVFSDSEIYSNVFPRRGARLALDVEARVRAMKREFQEFRQAQRQQWPLPVASSGSAMAASAASPPSPPMKADPRGGGSIGMAAPGVAALDRLESLI